MPLDPSRSKELAHDRLSDRFDALMDDYDLGRRVHTLVGRFLVPNGVAGRRVLDAGCGVGGVTRSLIAAGGRVVALDIGPALAAATRRRCGCFVAVGTLTALGLVSGSFDIVVSSEAIEHTPDPAGAVVELYRVVKPGGHLVVSTPNRLWQGPVRAASRLGLRPYDGHENFLWPAELRSTLERAGARIVEHRGLHLWPFQIRPLQGVSTWADRFGDRLLPLMINQCIHAMKPGSGV